MSDARTTSNATEWWITGSPHGNRAFGRVPYGNGARREDAVNPYDGPGRSTGGDGGHDPAEAAAQIRFLEEEVALLRRKLTESPRHLRKVHDDETGLALIDPRAGERRGLMI